MKTIDTQHILDTLFDDAAFDAEDNLITVDAVSCDQALEDMRANPMTMEGQLERCVAIDSQTLSAEALFAGMA